MDNVVKQIYEKFPKEEITDLPMVVFEGRIFVITTESDAERAVDYLLSQPILGFDTETRPCFRRGHHHNVSLLQVSTEDTAFLFRLNRIGLPKSVRRLLENKNITKVGLSLRDDLRALQQLGKFKAGTFFDIQDEVKLLGIQDMALQKIYANLFRAKISKKQQLSNWEADILSDAQKSYAAIDAWACIRLHREIHRLHDSGNYTLIPAPLLVEDEAPLEQLGVRS